MLIEMEVVYFIHILMKDVCYGYITTTSRMISLLLPEAKGGGRVLITMSCECL